MNKPKRTDVKRKNEIEVLNYLRVSGPRPRIDIAEEICLTKAAVTTLTNSMIAAGYLVERGELLTEEQKHQRGRRKILLDVNENCQLAFGAVVERDQLHIGLTNLFGEALDRVSIPLAGSSYRELLEKIAETFNRIIKNNCISSGKLLGAGICLSKSGEIYVEGNSPNEKLGRISRDLSHALPFPLIAVPTPVGALIGQVLFADRGIRNLLLIRFGDEQGSAVMTNGRTYRGSRDQAGDFDKLIRYRDVGELEPIMDGSGTHDGSNEKLNERLAHCIAVCCAVLDPEKVVGLGSYLEKEHALSHINLFLESRYSGHMQIFPALITEKNIFLASCASAIAKFFYMRNFDEIS